MRSVFTSSDPKDISYRVQQMEVSNRIEGIVPDPEIKQFVEELDRMSIEDIDERIRLIVEFIKNKDKA